MLNIISLGAGVQSSTMALMAAHGEITPMPDCAIFADTGAEPQYVYDWLDWLETKLPYPVHRVIEKEGLEINIINSIDGGRFAGAPFFTEPLKATESTVCSMCQGENPDCDWCMGTGKAETWITKTGGMLRRQCTNEFKIQPIRRKVRELMGLQKGERGGKEVKVIQWIGISTDEAQRMKPSGDAYIQHIWPLIEKNMSRNDCLQWMQKHSYPQPQKSSCYFCPYHSSETWRELKEDYPYEFARAVNMDRLIRGGVRGTTQKLYLHQSMQPLSEVDFKEQLDKKEQVDMFGNECEGMCGV